VAYVVHDLLPDRLQPQPRPPLGLLPVATPDQGLREFLAPTTRRWGASGISREQSRFHRTRTSRPMSASDISTTMFSLLSLLVVISYMGYVSFLII